MRRPKIDKYGVLHRNYIHCLEKQYMCTGAEDAKHTLKHKLINAIVTSANHAYSVCGREHIKGNRHDRVGHFVTTLRRELSCHFSAYTKAQLTQKAIWADAGMLDNVLGFSYLRFKPSQRVELFSFSELKEIVQMAQERIRNPTPDEMLQQSLEEIKGELSTSAHSVANVTNIVARSESTMTKIEELCQKLQDLSSIS